MMPYAQASAVRVLNLLFNSPVAKQCEEAEGLFRFLDNS